MAKNKKDLDLADSSNLNQIKKSTNVVFNILFVILALTCIIPVVFIFIISITSEQSIKMNGYQFIPESYSLDAYKFLFREGEMILRALGVSVLVTAVGTTLGVILTMLMGYVLSNMQVYPDYHSALISLTKNEQGRFNYIRGDSEGFVNIPLSIKDVVFSCFLREDTEKPMIKVSLRSVGTFPCNQLAAEFFNGGGHLNASGGEFYGTLEEAKKVLERALEKFKPLLNAKG